MDLSKAKVRLYLLSSEIEGAFYIKDYAMKKLWQKKKVKLYKLIETFETKDDILLDKKLTPYDVKGSAAHAKMLKKIGIITKDELKKLIQGLDEIAKLHDKGKFYLKMGDEDIHTKIENYLTVNFGEVGKKIHTARSRNDQILTVLRLYSKDKLEEVEKQILDLIGSIEKFNGQYGEIVGDINASEFHTFG